MPRHEALARVGQGYLNTSQTVLSLVPRPHPQKEGKGLAHFEPFLVFADSTVQDPGLPIRLQACDFVM